MTGEAYRPLGAREVRALRGLPRSLLPYYIRDLSRAGVRYRDVADALGLSESSIAMLAADGRPPVIGQRMPDGYAGYLRTLHAGRDPRLNAELASANDAGWSFATLGAVLGISAPAVRTRVVRARQDAPGPTKTYAPTPTRTHPESVEEH